MGAVMFAGMVFSAAVFLFTVGLTWDEATVERPVASLLVIATGMTVPMAAWMLYRGMGVRNSAEMAGAMALPVLPFLCLVWFDVTKSALCGGYCIVALVAMIGLMMYRRSEYSMEMHSDQHDGHG
jgi:flagellar biosynthetic protein FliP